MGSRIQCNVIGGGELSNRKGVNRQGGGISAPALTEKDLADIRVAAELGSTISPLSFARDADDIRERAEASCASGAARPA